jgi:hypothetical protein
MARLRAAFDVQAAKQSPQMHLDGVFTDPEFDGNIAIAHASIDHDQQLLLAFG